MTSPSCPKCLDIGWVCENHPDRPWDRTLPNGCECGAGMPCECVLTDEMREGVERPDVSGVFKRIDKEV